MAPFAANIASKIQKVPTKTRVYGFGVFVLISCVLFIYFVHIPMTTQIKQLEKDVSGLQATIKSNDEKIKKLDDLRAEVKTLEERLRQLTENMQVAQGQGGMQIPGGKAMKGLTDTLRQQQQLSDNTFQDLQRRFEKQGQQGFGEPGQTQGQQGQGGDRPPQTGARPAPIGGETPVQQSGIDPPLQPGGEEDEGEDDRRERQHVHDLRGQGDARQLEHGREREGDPEHEREDDDADRAAAGEHRDHDRHVALTLGQERLEAAGAEYSRIATANSIPGAAVVVFRDPDNIQLEIFFDPAWADA